LTQFCTSLTGITQQQVDQANPIEKVLNAVDYFLEPYKNSKMAVVNDCGSDMKRFLYKETKHKKIELKPYFDYFINLKKIFPDEEKCGKKIRDINSLLDCFGLTFKGRKHSGMDDAINISKVIIELLHRGYIFSSLLLESTYPLELTIKNQVYDYLIVINFSLDKKTDSLTEFSAVFLNLNNNQVVWNNLVHHIFNNSKNNSEKISEMVKILTLNIAATELKNSKFVFGSLTARPFNFIRKIVQENNLPFPQYVNKFFVMRNQIPEIHNYKDKKLPINTLIHKTFEALEMNP
jgi:hypothetical protein